MIQKCFHYYKYSDLTHFTLIDPIPKRCAKFTPHGIPCEYYTVPRTITDLPPAGFTSYTTYVRYDVNTPGKLVRVALRLPKYKNSDGQVCVEKFNIISGEYTDAALLLLHMKYSNPDISFETLNHTFPLGKNASKKALELLFPWAEKKGFLPGYPRNASHLWFFELPYKNSILTCCLDCSDPSDPALFDIIIDNDYASLFLFVRSEKVISICMSANYALYQHLHKLFPSATFVFDMHQLPSIYDKYMSSCSNEIRSQLILKQQQINDCLKKMDASPVDATRKICISAISFLLHCPQQITAFQQNLEYIMREQPDFLDSYFLNNTFYSYLPTEFKNSIQTFYKNRGYSPERFAYMLLSYDEIPLEYLIGYASIWGMDIWIESTNSRARMSKFIHEMSIYCECVRNK